ncbi:hypothetical protein NTGM5_20001 [Candidatus Nitrotoga sp. M5]|nr:hypothetical protein NTGM5_20001 [Candidatus Nitrotoga sp. M5]
MPPRMLGIDHVGSNLSLNMDNMKHTRLGVEYRTDAFQTADNKNISDKLILFHIT